MRYIDIGRLRGTLTQEWKRKAKIALDDVRSAKNAEERKAKLAQHAGVWSDVKHDLRSLSHKKCWYCESKDVRSDNAVDHFRPKGRVAEDTSHPGYWWLAFEWTNFRYSCTYCNSRRRDVESRHTGGKQDHFPVFNPSDRSASEGPHAAERPVLLDPTIAADTILMYFSDDGMVIPRLRGLSADVVHRIEKSIELYHLCHTELVDARLELFNIVRSSIELGRRFYLAWLAGDANAEAGFNAAVEGLKRLITEDAEFSQAARDMIKGLRENGHPWIDELV